AEIGQEPVFFNKYLVIIFCIYTASGNLFAQYRLIDKANSFYNLDSALKYGDLSVKYAKLTHDSIQLIESYLFLSAQYNERSLYEKSEKYCQYALGLSLSKKNSLLIGSCYSGFANMYNYKNDYAKALNYYIKANKIFERETDYKKQLKSLTDLAEYYRKIISYAKAQHYLNKAFALYDAKELNDTLQLIRLYNRQAAVMHERNKYDSSLYFSFKAVGLCQKIHNPRLEARSLNEIGSIYKKKGQLQKAIACYTKARDIWLKEKLYANAIEAMNNLALLYEQNNYPRALTTKHFTDIINLTSTHKLDFALNYAYMYLHKVSIEEHDTAKAYISLLGLKKHQENSLYKKLNSEITAITEKYENEKIKTEVDTMSNQLRIQKKETMLGVGISIVLLVLLAFTGYLFYNNIQKKKLLQKQNHYKDVLIQEIHHRVKNNLQFISSLINIQRNASLNVTEIQTLNDTSRRINAMSLVHEMLYNQDNIEGVPLNRYLHELINLINELVNTTKIPITFNLSIDEAIASPNQATAIGMITNELISNSIKHAFTKQDKPVIKIQLSKIPGANDYCYSVSDNGIGCNVDFTDQHTLGMRLINIFSRQLKGKFSFMNKEGLTFTIKFTI
ncbi:MAG: histidine kinase dimerization/phosphoacceptor domain -containing protein, partial [Bacteroidota bacterium]